MKSLAADGLARPLEEQADVAGGDTGCLLDGLPGQVARDLGALDWDFASACAETGAHAIHPYPAKFIPQLARQAITALSQPGDLVLDPFAGGGTTAVEAIASGRRCWAIDANPVGNAVARAKTTPLDAADLHELQHLEAALLALDQFELTAPSEVWLPAIPKVEKWYRADIFQAIAVIRQRIMAIDLEGARNLALVALMQAGSRLSFQDSETRYASRPRDMDILDAPRTVIAELRRMRRLVERASIGDHRSAVIVEGDARQRGSFDLEPGSAGLVLTSPPYPNAYDYHLYHRFRLFWLGCDPADLRRVEIGSHLKGQSLDHPIETYLTDMRAVLANCFTALEPGRYAVVVVGDGLFKGEVFDTAGHMRSLGAEIGYDHVVTMRRSLPVHRRSVTRPGRRLTEEHLVVLRRPLAAANARVIGPNYKLFPYESELRDRELNALGGSPRRAASGDVDVVLGPGLHHAAFCHGFELSTGEQVASLQRILEGAAATDSRRKNSTYFAHGIHRYKGKFYPQLAKSLINLSGLDPGHSLVLDPFGGSGTMSLEAVLSGLDALSIDCNPVATAVARSKLMLASTSPTQFAQAVSGMRARLKEAPAQGSPTLSQFSSSTRSELDRWFPKPVLHKLDWLLASVREADTCVVGLLEVLASDIIREISQQEPKDLRIRRRTAPIADADVYGLFTARLEQAVKRVQAVWRELRPSHLSPGAGRALRGDATDAQTFATALGDRLIDAVVSSPPYATALPYLDTDRLSLAAVFGMAAPERKVLEDRMIGSREITESTRVTLEEQLDKEDEEPTLPPSTRSFLREYHGAVLRDQKAGFRRRQAPAVLFRYFRSMSGVLASLKPHLSAGAYCWFVLGDSRSTVGGRSWRIPTVDEIAAIAVFHGYSVVDRVPITVTREGLLNAHNAITRNQILQLQAPPPH